MSEWLAKFPLGGIEHLLGHNAVTLDGFTVSGATKKLKVFLTKGTTCAGCGLQANVWRVYPPVRPGGNHVLDLFHAGDLGVDTIFTRDHIVPKASGGGDGPSNSQPMCEPCNTKKGSEIVPGSRGMSRKKAMGKISELISRHNIPDRAGLKRGFMSILTQIYDTNMVNHRGINYGGPVVDATEGEEDDSPGD